MIYTIYKATNIKNGKSYIGFDSKWPNRIAGHKHKSLYSNSQTKFHKAIREYGFINFEFSILYQSLDKDHTLDHMEQYFIDLYDSINNGYNKCQGGAANWLGQKHTKNTKIKIGLANKGKTHSKETRLKIRNTQLGKKLSEETKRNMSISRHRYLDTLVH